MKFTSEKELIEPCNSNCSFCFLNYADILGENYLFRGLDSKEIGEIIKNIHHQVKKYNKEDIIAYSGEEYNSLYIIVEGAVVGEIIDFEGKVLRIEELRAPDTIASAFIFGDTNQLPVNVKAVSDTRLLIIPRPELLKLFSKNKKVLHNYLNIISDRAQHLSRKIKMLGFQNIKSKIAYYLLEQQKVHKSKELYLKHSQTELAEIFGIARPSLARVLGELNKEGIISSKRRLIKILDSNRLSSLLNTA